MLGVEIDHDAVFWSRDLLPTDYANARILAFEYEKTFLQGLVEMERAEFYVGIRKNM